MDGRAFFLGDEDPPRKRMRVNTDAGCGVIAQTAAGLTELDAVALPASLADAVACGPTPHAPPSAPAASGREATSDAERTSPWARAVARAFGADDAFDAPCGAGGCNPGPGPRLGEASQPQPQPPCAASPARLAGTESPAGIPPPAAATSPGSGLAAAGGAAEGGVAAEAAPAPAAARVAGDQPDAVLPSSSGSPEDGVQPMEASDAPQPGACASMDAAGDRAGASLAADASPGVADAPAAMDTAAAGPSSGAGGAGAEVTAAASGDAPAVEADAATAAVPPPSAADAGGSGSSAAFEPPRLDAESVAYVEETLQLYKSTVQMVVTKKLVKAKPDMKAYSMLREQRTPEPMYGHPPGVRIGQEFLGRGEVAIVGVHTTMMGGIDARKEATRGAYAIVLAGGYKDDDDTGETFWYTGEGGQEGKKQAKDQEWSKGNKALRDSCQSGTPVRVVRARVGPAKERLYVYDGLYRVVEARMEKSHEGPLVCKFKMTAVPGHSQASSKVEHGCLSKSRWASVMLAQTTGPVPKIQPLQARDKLLAAIRKRAAKGERLLCADISRGVEKVPIPVWNDVDDDMTLPDLTYISQFEAGHTSARAAQLASRAAEQWAHHVRDTCGRKWNGETVYTADGRLLQTHSGGVMECGPGCASKACQRTRVATQGLRFPLEVFKTPSRGMGVRCPLRIPAGGFIAAYIGALHAEAEGEAHLHEEDFYLFDLDHFQEYLAEAREGRDVADARERQRLPPLLPEMREPELNHLVVDAAKVGNVARFLNHSCAPNCTKQTVFVPGAGSLALFLVAFFAERDISPKEELTYDYGYSPVPETDAEGNPVACRLFCHCGAANCRKRLLQATSAPQPSAAPVSCARTVDAAQAVMATQASDAASAGAASPPAAAPACDAVQPSDLGAASAAAPPIGAPTPGDAPASAGAKGSGAAPVNITPTPDSPSATDAAPASAAPPPTDAAPEADAAAPSDAAAASDAAAPSDAAAASDAAASSDAAAACDAAASSDAAAACDAAAQSDAAPGSAAAPVSVVEPAASDATPAASVAAPASAAAPS